MDLETLFTTVYVLVDDWYKEEMVGMRPKVGAPPRMSDSEVLTVALVGQWRVGVPWQSERGLVRYIQAQALEMFPTMLQVSAFNQRVRHLLGVLVALQERVGGWLHQEQERYECVDSLPLPAGSPAQHSRENGHWLWTAQIGRIASGWVWGDRLLMSVTGRGVITGWLVGAADINDRWLLEAFLSCRAGQPQLVEPPRRVKDAQAQHTPPPIGFIGGWCACGGAIKRPYLADGNFNGSRWQHHWHEHYAARVLAVPRYNEAPQWSSAHKSWLRRHRQIIETVFARLDLAFAIKRLQAHSRWGQYTRLAAKSAAYNLGLYINQGLGRPLGALATLLC